jgi:protein lifeguard
MNNYELYKIFKTDQQQQFYGQSPYPQQPGYPPQQPGYPPQGPPNYSQPYNPAYPHQMPYSPPYNDAETANVDGYSFDDESIRKGFIRKVYSILSCQLLVSAAFITIFVFHEPTKLWVRHHPELMWVSIGVLFVTMIALSCCESVRRSFPMNFIFLALFTLAQSFMLGVISSVKAQDVVLMAVGITAAVCIGLTIFAFQTKWDFTVCGGELKTLFEFQTLLTFFDFSKVCCLSLQSYF